METKRASASNLIRFPGPRSAPSARLDQRSLMEAVYAAGSLPIAAEDRATKALATRLTIFGFAVIDEVQPDGTARRLRPSEAIQACMKHPWRVSRPSSRYAVGELPATDRELFSAHPA